MFTFGEKLTNENISCDPFIKGYFQIVPEMTTYLELFKNSHQCFILVVDVNAQSIGFVRIYPEETLGWRLSFIFQFDDELGLIFDFKTQQNLLFLF